MENQKVIGVTQGGCGVVLNAERKVHGLYTDGVESCLAIVYECELGDILFHDSGQLRVTEICELVGRLGQVKNIHAAIGPALDGSLHQPRLDKIIANIGYVGDVQTLQVNSSRYAVFYSRKNGLSRAAPDLEGVLWPPNRKAREAINVLRDLFLEPGSQQLSVDVQYQDGRFTDQPQLAPSIPEILDLVKSQPNFFLMNVKTLGRYAAEGVVSIPNWLSEFYERSNIESASLSDRELELVLYKQYIELHCNNAP